MRRDCTVVGNLNVLGPPPCTHSRSDMVRARAYVYTCVCVPVCVRERESVCVFWWVWQGVRRLRIRRT